MYEDLKEYYREHTCKETLEKYNIKNKQKLLRILKEMNYDFSIKKKSFLKGKKSTRSHESYVLGGKKSAKTQKESWNSKTDEEKEKWRQLQIDTHSTEEYKKLMSNISKEVYNNLSEEDKKRMNISRSESMKDWWNGLSEKERQNILNKQKENGAGWNHETIRKTIHERYNVDNVSQIEELKPIILESTRKTCREKYGVDYYVLTNECQNAIGAKWGHTKPNEDFNKLLLDCSDIEYTNTNGVDREFGIGKYRYDFKIGDTLIEINPSPTHNSSWNMFKDGKPLSKYYHRDKSDFARKNNFRCIHVFDWDDQNKIIQLLKKRERLYARNCEIREVYKKEAKEFLNKYHLQNFARCSILLGLYYKDELISIMTFGKPRYSSIADYELIRYCSIKDVIGGSSKLLRHFIETYKPKTIVSYCDESKFDGSTYVKLGFKLVKTRVPSKHWYNIKTGEHYTDSLIRQQGFSRIIHHKNASEDNLDTSNNRTLMLREGFVEIYDCGQSTYLLDTSNI